MNTDEPYNSSLEALEVYEHQIAVLEAEVKRLTTMLNIAENNIPRSIHWDCYWEALVEAGLETIEDEDEWEEEG